MQAETKLEQLLDRENRLQTNLEQLKPRVQIYQHMLDQNEGCHEMLISKQRLQKIIADVQDYATVKQELKAIRPVIKQAAIELKNAAQAAIEVNQDRIDNANGVLAEIAQEQFDGNDSLYKLPF